ncbi:hypothetical protein E2C01_065741 [Portunus trituberculatus]|uniref:Uncharacterized protein n=1 Tax=Portunus trituberculatus TaxID=210409 RepID=A0A5B7HMW7_PORTR|nr:hypothetical protein [Portunus trituberculatus]
MPVAHQGTEDTTAVDGDKWKAQRMAVLSRQLRNVITASKNMTHCPAWGERGQERTQQITKYS